MSRRKRGFDVPIRDWLGNVARSETRDRLLGSSQLGDLFAPQLIEEMLAGSDAASRHGWRIWALLFLDEWLSQHRVARLEVSST